MNENTIILLDAGTMLVEQVERLLKAKELTQVDKVRALNDVAYFRFVARKVRASERKLDILQRKSEPVVHSEPMLSSQEQVHLAQRDAHSAHNEVEVKCPLVKTTIIEKENV